jgi:hypothetical protein
MYKENSGVYPLVCAVCKRIVGVINIAEFDRMVAAEAVYICSYCLHRPEQYVEFTLKNFTPEQWADMTTMVVQVPTYLAIAEFNHTVPVGSQADPLNLAALI